MIVDDLSADETVPTELSIRSPVGRLCKTSKNQTVHLEQPQGTCLPSNEEEIDKRLDRERSSPDDLHIDDDGYSSPSSMSDLNKESGITSEMTSYCMDNNEQIVLTASDSTAFVGEIT